MTLSQLRAMLPRAIRWREDDVVDIEFYSAVIAKLPALLAAAEALRPFAYAREHSGTELKVADFDAALAALSRLEKPE